MKFQEGILQESLGKLFEKPLVEILKKFMEKFLEDFLISKKKMPEGMSKDSL